MKQDIKQELEKAKSQLIIVEGKKDKLSLQNLGFNNIFVLNETGKTLGEKIEEIEQITEKNKVKICILTDFDKKGKQLYLKLKSELSQRKVRMDNSLRNMLLKIRLSHIEGLSTYIENNENV